MIGTGLILHSIYVNYSHKSKKGSKCWDLMVRPWNVDFSCIRLTPTEIRKSKYHIIRRVRFRWETTPPPLRKISGSAHVVITGVSARIQVETTENYTWFFNALCIKHRHTGRRFNVSSERQLVIFNWPAGDSNPQPVGTRNILITSPTLYLLS